MVPKVAALLASAEEFLPILERQLASWLPPQLDDEMRAAVLETLAYKTAAARVGRLRDAIAALKEP